MDAPVADSRHLRGPAATLSINWRDQEGELADAAGTVTVRVQKADGTDVLAAGTATAGTNPYTVGLTPAHNTTLELLTATWTASGDSQTRQTLHEIVGGFYFSAADARTFAPALEDSDQFPTAIIQRRRAEVERECERITAVAWVPRYARVFLDGADDMSIVLPNVQIRSVRSVKVFNTPTTSTAFDADDLEALEIYPDGTISRPNDVFVEGNRNVVVEYEHGFDRPPDDLLHATLARLKYRLNMENTTLSDQADAVTIDGYGTIHIADKGPGLYRTGQPEVDAIYQRYSVRLAKIPGRTLDYDPTRRSLFHGGRH